MSKDKFITTTDRGAKPYRVRLKAWSIEKYFAKKVEARRYRDRIVSDLDALAALIEEGVVQGHYTKNPSSMIDRIDDADYRRVIKAIPDLHVDIRRALGTEVAGDELGNATVDIEGKDDITVREMILSYVENWEAERSKEIYNKERFNWWAHHSPIAGKLTERIGHRDMIDSRNAFKNSHTGTSNSTVNDAMKIFYTAWKYKLEVLHIGRTAPPKLQRLKQQRTRTTPYTRAEAQAMIDFWYEKDAWNAEHCKRCVFKLFGPLTELLALTAIRKSFIESLEWSHVHWNEKVIRRPMKGDDGIAERAVPLSDRALKVLRGIYDQKLHEKFVFPSPRGVGHVQRWDAYWTKTLREEGFELSEKPIHAFRAMVATELHYAGRPRREIATVLACTEENLVNYITPDEETELRDARDALESLTLH